MLIILKKNIGCVISFFPLSLFLGYFCYSSLCGMSSPVKTNLPPAISTDQIPHHAKASVSQSAPIISEEHKEEWSIRRSFLSGSKERQRSSSSSASRSSFFNWPKSPSQRTSPSHDSSDEHSPSLEPVLEINKENSYDQQDKDEPHSAFDDSSPLTSLVTSEPFSDSFHSLQEYSFNLGGKCRFFAKNSIAQLSKQGELFVSSHNELYKSKVDEQRTLTLIGEQPRNITLLSISDDGQIAYSSDGKALFRWDVQREFSRPHEITQARSVVNGVVINAISQSRENGIITLAYSNKRIAFFDMSSSSKSLIKEISLPDPEEESIIHIKTDATAHRLLVQTKSSLYLYDQETLIWQLPERVCSFDISQDGTFFVTGEVDGILRFWQIEKDGVLLPQPLCYATRHHIHSRFFTVNFVRISPDDKTVLSECFGNVYLWEAKTADWRQRFASQESHSSVPVAFSFSRNSRRIYLAQNNGFYKSWKKFNNTLLQSLAFSTLARRFHDNRTLTPDQLSNEEKGLFSSFPPELIEIITTTRLTGKQKHSMKPRVKSDNLLIDSQDTPRVALDPA